VLGECIGYTVAAGRVFIDLYAGDCGAIVLSELHLEADAAIAEDPGIRGLLRGMPFHSHSHSLEHLFFCFFFFVFEFSNDSLCSGIIGVYFLVISVVLLSCFLTRVDCWQIDWR
jgi:hypothetical protein